MSRISVEPAPDAVYDFPFFVLLIQRLAFEANLFDLTPTSFRSRFEIDGETLNVLVTGRGLAYTTIEGFVYPVSGTFSTIRVTDSSGLVGTIENIDLSAAVVDEAIRAEEFEGQPSAFEDLLLSLDWAYQGTDLPENIGEGDRFGRDAVVFNPRGNDSAVLGAGDDRFFTGDGNDRIRGGNGDDTLDGGTGNDRIFGNGGDDSAEGDFGNDRLVGNGGDDLLFGGPGADTAIGGAGADGMDGGPGSDVLRGGRGEDALVGGEGNDTAVGGGGADGIDGQDGNDRLRGQGGDDTLVGGGGRDTLDGGGGDDAIGGRAGDDAIDGGRGVDELFGEAGRDTIFGGRGDDSLFGGGGGDRLVGGRGSDVLFGGTGRDVFSFGARDGGDAIADFENGRDLIEITAGVTRRSDVTITDTNVGVVVSFASTAFVLSDFRLADLDRGDFIL